LIIIKDSFFPNSVLPQFQYRASATDELGAAQ